MHKLKMVDGNTLVIYDIKETHTKKMWRMSSAISKILIGQTVVTEQTEAQITAIK